MASLLTSADELLRTRSIPELRDLVNSLENDGNSKITELQVMVGSKYHDFIQSADAIAAMQSKSEFLESNLCRFLKLSQDVVTKTKDLLSRTVDNNGSDIKQSAPLKLFRAVDSHDVWSYLEECDIFSAAKIVAQSRIFQEAYCMSIHRSKVREEESTFQFCRFFSATSVKEISLGCECGSIAGAAQLFSSCSSVAFLSQTVLDDARLLLLEGSCSFDDKASCLASVGLISLGADGIVCRSDLLLVYLEGADMLLDSALKDLGDGPVRDSAAKNKDAAAAKPSPSSTTAMMGEKLIQAVQSLQQAILDVHLLFFKPTPLPSSSSSTDGAETGTGVAVMVSGLVILKQVEFISDVDRALSPLLLSSALDSTFLSAQRKSMGFDRSSFLADDKASSPVGDTRKLFDQWIARAVQRVGERARAALEAMDSATDVARLQQRVWLCCTTVATSSSSSACVPLRRPLQADWEEACVELLAVKRRRPAAVADSSAAAASLLWSRVFRLPFMLQVERLLRESCMEVLRSAKGLLLQSLAQEGVTVDPVSLIATLSPSSSTASAWHPSSGVNGTRAGTGAKYCYSNVSAPSSRTFRRAEAVRSLLQEELSDLLRDVIVPVQEGDPESSTGLSRALFIQCSQLAGQVAILLRSLCTSLTAAIDANNKLAAAAMGGGGGRGGALGGSARDTNAPLLSGLLLVGRLSWLLKIRGRFLEEALTPPSSSSSSEALAGSNSLDLVSEDQMRSAFEIADTNGDGVLTYSEAVEAVHALAVSDTDNSSSSSTSIPFLSQRLTPSLNFNEFALLCAHLMTASACAPVSRLQSCFNETLSVAHTHWAKKVVLDFSPSLSSGLLAELGGVSGTGTDGASQEGKGNRGVASFKTTWRQEWVELDSDVSADADGNREQVSLPTSVSASLAAYLFFLTHSAACSLISVDTVQQLPPSNLFAPTDTTSSVSALEEMEDSVSQVNRMALFASSSLYSSAIAAVGDTYSSLLRSASTSTSTTSPSQENEGLQSEDVALQVVFDLMVCADLEARCGVESPVMQRCLEGWRARLEPINAEILTPLLIAATEQLSRRTHLLLPGLKKPRASVAAAQVATHTPPSSSSSVAANSNASVISGLFPPAAASRFSLLPLPMSTHFQGQSWVDRDRERERERDRDRDIVRSVDRATTESSHASKSILSGLSLSQQQMHAEQLGKSLISSWGTFLGSNANAASASNPNSNSNLSVK